MSETAACSNIESRMDAGTVNNLAKGLMEIYEPPLATISTHLKELTERQEAVHSTLAVERKRLDDLHCNAMADALLANVAMNRDRLVAISNAMGSLHKRVNALQARAANVEKVAKVRAAKLK